MGPPLNVNLYFTLSGSYNIAHMLDEFPKKIDDLPKALLPSGKRPWTMLDNHRRASGDLNLSDSISRLSILTDEVYARSIKFKYLNKVTGLNDSSNRITLYDSLATEDLMAYLFNRTHSGKKQSNLNSKITVLHYGNKTTDDKIQNLTGYLPGIGSWFDRDLLDFDYSNYQFKENSIIYHPIEVSRGVDITLNSKLCFEAASALQFEKLVAYPQSYVEIKYENKVPISNALNAFRHIENFFNFLFQHPYNTNIFTSTRKPTRAKHTEKYYILTPKQTKGNHRTEKVWESGMLFKLSDITNFDQVFKNWLLNYDKIHEMVDVLLLLKTTPVSEEMRFTSIINAIESVHRRYYDIKTQSDTDYQLRVNAITAQLDDENDRKFVSDKLSHGNEMNLRERLSDIFIIGASHGIEQPNSVMKNKIMQTRNYLTHGDESVKTQTLIGFDLEAANGLLGRYLKLLILRILKITDDEITAIVENSGQFQDSYRDAP